VELSQQAREARDPATALAHAQSAAEIGRETDDASLLAIATLRLAELGAATAADVTPLYAKIEPGMASFLKLNYLLVLAELSGDEAHLREAVQHLDHLIANAPDRYRVTLVEQHPVHRAIASAAAALD
jgi:hypothetical protein